MKTALLFVLVLAAALGGCGSSAPVSPLEHVLGAWSSSSGSSTVTCDGATPASTPVTARVTFSAGAAGELLEANGSCVARFGGAGDVLTAEPGQTCWERTDGATTLVVESETFTSLDGLNAIDEARGRLEGASSSPCAWTGSIAYVRP